MPKDDPVQRMSGVLLHPTSFPGPYAIGDLGPEAYAFIDFLVTAGQSLWQVLPLGPTGYGDSPYACYSAFAGNTLLVSPEKLVEDGLLAKKDLASIHHAAGERVNYAAVHKSKEFMLHQALEGFRKSTDTKLRAEFEAFRQRYSSWLPDYALFQALKDAYEGVAWNEWDPRLVRREPAALSAARDKLREKIESEEFGQFL